MDDFGKALANLVELITWTLGIALIALAWVAWNYHNEQHDGSCDAPCSVHFSANTQEDEYGLDFRHHTVKVFKVKP